MGILCNAASPEQNDLQTIFCYIDNITKLAGALAGGIAIIFLLWGAFNYFTAYGNEEKANKGKTIVTWSIIGIIVILLSGLIVALVQNTLI